MSPTAANSALSFASPSVGGVRVEFSDGSEREFQADWLRDNCRCDRCRIVQTDERRFQPWKFSGPAEAAGASVSNGVLTVDWSDGHCSTFSTGDFTSIFSASQRGRHSPRLWRGDHHLTRVDHAAVLAEPAEHRRMFEALRQDGVAVITGAPPVPGTVLTTSEALGITLVDSSLGFLFDVKLDPAGFNVAFTSEALAPHNDNAQYRYPPSGQVLSMVANDATGGDSQVVDGFAVLDALEALDPSAVDVLSRVKVGFRQYSAVADGMWRSPLVVRDPEGGFERLRFSNALRQPLDPEHPDLAEWYRAYRLLGSLVCDPFFAVTFRLTAGDMLFVHGDRVLHARTAFTPDGPRHLQDVFFNIDDVYSHLDRVSGMAPDAMRTTSSAG